MVYRFTLFFTFVLALNLVAKEQVKVSEVIDANLFQLKDGALVSLANVKALSINTKEKTEIEFAKKIFKSAKKNYEKEQVLVEFVDSDSGSVQLVHMWKQLPFGTESINAAYLRKGFAEFVPEPESKYSKQYSDAAIDAARKNKGIHDPKNISEPLPKFQRAFWVNGGIGFGFVSKGRSSVDFYFGDANLNYRYSNLVICGGMQKATNGVSDINVQYLSMGFSLHDRKSEFVYTIGITRNQYIHDTECEMGIYKSDFYYALVMKVQVFAHTPLGLGMGFGFDANLSDERSYYMGSLFICFGNWG